MKNKSPQLGRLGTAFFSLVQMRHMDEVRLGDLQAPLGLTADQEQQLLKRLTRNGFIIRLISGVFLVPNKIPVGGFWQPNSYYVILKLMQYYNAKYYIGGLSAMQYYGLTSQIPNEITLFNDKINAKKTIGTQRFHLIKVSDERLLGSWSIDTKTIDGEIYMATLAQTLLDAVQYWKRLGTLPEGYEWIKHNVRDMAVINELIRLATLGGNVITMRRIGYCLEMLGVSQNLLEPLRKRLTATQGWIVFDPNLASKGKTNKRWRIIDNAGLL